ncbi:hypothetical protein CY35_04G069700 [Sphagnum magellanicum]|nr:hypothetical protein CY35_04G069700 [Sphagnum magellanicum]
MAGVGRSVSGSFVSATRSVLRVFMNSSDVAGAGSKRAVGTRVMAPLKPAVRSVPFSHSSSSTTCGAESSRRSASHFLRLGGEMACAQSLLPLHSAIATSRMVAQLSTTAEMMLQGTLTHISPDRSDGWISSPV